VNNSPPELKFKKETEQIKKMSPKNVVFNFECCGGIQNEIFPDEKNTLMSIFYFLRNGYTIQVADFTLKALITGWKKFENDPQFSILFGSVCPFVKIDECNDQMNLKFSIDALANCDVPQLRAVALLVEPDKITPNKNPLVFPSEPIQELQQTTQNISDSGSLTLHVMGSTIVASFIEQQNAVYTSTILTVASFQKYNNNNNNNNLLYQIKAHNSEHTGTLGHALLNYPEGGKLICSTGHFCELTKINTTQERLRAYTCRMPTRLSAWYEEQINRATTTEENTRLASDMMQMCSNTGDY
jgi:hypothetical protein